jgi:hypothetical protein
LRLQVAKLQVQFVTSAVLFIFFSVKGRALTMNKSGCNLKKKLLEHLKHNELKEEI